ncbi:hypothetical protein QCD60_26785 [Pokkaliibacter sp. MBI-7]|uniref:hypothetical protein n=1 Tax=Pokkaliibacter sp. MBI-7 TaxID=3040600 RepID=UPI0024493BA0|nr:hypothetical protein [Pokkaliibacter sp. MBI-7]MDH2436142.1 hypothetical protein [Pokkaliibacter sp. MBI-7]
MIQYFKSWSKKEKAAKGILTESEARELHQKGKIYCAAYSSANSYLEVMPNCVMVCFLDINKKPELNYIFSRSDEGPLFLEQVFIKRFEKTDDATYVEHYIFKKDGSLFITKVDYISKMRDEGEGMVNISSNYDHFPDFGQYEHLLIRDRGVPKSKF